MNPQKMKDWLIKITNANLQKPSQNAYLQSLTTQIQELSVRVNHILNTRDRKMVMLEDQVNLKTSQLVQIENKVKEDWYTLQKKAQRQKEKRLVFIKNSTKSIMESVQMMRRKFRTMQSELQQKNVLESISSDTQLEKLKQGRIKASQTKTNQQKSYQNELKNRIKKADQIIKSQEQDILLIQKYQKQLISRCETIQKQYQGRLTQKWQRSEQKQKLILRKLQLLISEIEIE